MYLSQKYALHFRKPKGGFASHPVEVDVDLVTLPVNRGRGLGYQLLGCVQAVKTNSVERITPVMRNVLVNYDTKHNSCDKKREILHIWSRLLVWRHIPPGYEYLNYRVQEIIRTILMVYESHLIYGY